MAYRIGAENWIDELIYKTATWCFHRWEKGKENIFTKWLYNYLWEKTRFGLRHRLLRKEMCFTICRRALQLGLPYEKVCSHIEGLTEKISESPLLKENWREVK